MNITEKQIDFFFSYIDNVIAKKKEAVDNCLRLANDVKTLKAKPENKPPYQINLLDIVQTDEPQTSLFLNYFFRFTQNGKYVLLETFIDRFLDKVGLSSNNIRRPRISSEKDHIDVCILDDNYAIIIENKLKNAPFQRNQLGRYIKIIHDKGYPYDKIYLVLLPQYTNSHYIERIRKSAWRCPQDWQKSNANRSCAINDPYQCRCDDNNFIPTKHCDQCIDFLSGFKDRIVVVHAELSDWLIESSNLIPAKETLLISALQQFSDFTRGLYHTRINNNLSMDIQKHIAESILADIDSNFGKWTVLHDRINELSEIKATMESMKRNLAKELIDEWYHELKPEWPGIQREVNQSFGLLIHGVWVGCWCGSNNEGTPYWGFYCENSSEEQRQMVSQILSECDLSIPQSTTNFIAWDNTLHGADKCRAFYEAAKRLNLLTEY